MIFVVLEAYKSVLNEGIVIERHIQQYYSDIQNYNTDEKHWLGRQCHCYWHCFTDCTELHTLPSTLLWCGIKVDQSKGRDRLINPPALKTAHEHCRGWDSKNFWTPLLTWYAMKRWSDRRLSNTIGRQYCHCWWPGRDQLLSKEIIQEENQIQIIHSSTSSMYPIQIWAWEIYQQPPAPNISSSSCTEY